MTAGVQPGTTTGWVYPAVLLATLSVIVVLLGVASHSVVCELVEWGAALAFGEELGQACLGTQGDVWDAQKDMALAMLGAVISVTALGLAGRLPVRREGSDPGPGGDSPHSGTVPAAGV